MAEHYGLPIYIVRGHLLNSGSTDVNYMIKTDNAIRLIDVLQNPKNNRDYEKAAKALGELRDPSAFELLVALLKDDKKGSIAIVEAIGEYRDACAIEPLSAAVNSQNCTSIANALLKIGSPAFASLVTMLDNRDAKVRLASARALAQLGDPRSIDPLLITLSDRDEFVRDVAANALDRIGWKPEKDEFGIAYWIAKEEWSKCIEIGTSAIASLNAVVNKQNCELIANALLNIGSPGIEALVTMLNNHDIKVRIAFAGALAQLGDPRSTEPLLIALLDKNEFVRNVAANTLDKIGWKPKKDDFSITYWIAKQEWSKCIEIGAPPLNH